MKVGENRLSSSSRSSNAIARQHLDELKAKGTSSAKSILLFYEHYPVFTIGIRNKSVDSAEKKRLEDLGAEFHFTNRGGLLTFHGPGQLVLLSSFEPGLFKKSLRWYVASLEKTLVETCKSLMCLQALRATLECVRSSRWITTHGIALNCDIDLSWFEHFIPCGLEGKGVTSLSKETKQTIQPQDTIPAFIESFQNVFDCTVVSDNGKDLRTDGVL
ncbi:Putative lipoyltransferase 2, mitochondrial [Desmophyllum pertusum]|uniref:Octanoyl-[acyl-carrier-protein]:protein N-octanoyltransferase LIPT2, mitochondrial n=1 Tax=Desmophyllum pertusum TaxID=174260 RepID=A0A9W9ZMC7_9CNID|nr:Putative lipoyltransferase 2, mitochondrial [Desmophyllum pertusum]